eukprot:1161825-Pelagomonas_calceolata.AAC.7
MDTGKVRLHRYIRLQGQLSGNTEACNLAKRNAHNTWTERKGNGYKVKERKGRKEGRERGYIAVPSYEGSLAEA